ncbi:MAG: penicillin acylase family protein [Pseudomonadota bacterium]
MNAILKWLIRIFGALAVLTAVALLLGWYLVSRSLPDYEGRIEVVGLDAQVTVIRDAHAVPHIRASTTHDAFFALGLVQAQDRLWQMELSRRAAQGRLSALLGAHTVKVDRLVKTLDLYGHASRSLAVQSPQARRMLDAHAAGINAWIRQVNERALGRGAPEFFAFPTAISPWTPADSLAILKLMALRLSNAAASEVRRARTMLTLDPDRVADILPEYPVAAQVAPKRPTVVLPGADRAFAPEEQDEMLAAFGLAPFPEAAGASNSWAVDGTRTASGRPLMANDPHLWLAAPGIWYLADIQAPGLAAIGGTLPGAPLILIGRNQELAWGLTTTGLDDQDLYVSRTNPINPEQYEMPDGSWADFATRSIRIEVKDALPETEVVKSTRHGPVLTGRQFDAHLITPEGHVTALAWTALADDDTTMTAGLEVMLAQSVEEGITAASKAVAPAQNLMLADSAGVGMVVAGRLPKRQNTSLSQGRVPSGGAISENDWQGALSFEENPRVIRPAGGAVANANNRVTDQPYPNHLSFDWAPPYRMLRLEKELGARAFHSRDGFVALQNDSISEMARSLLPLMARDLWWREGTPLIEEPLRRRALELLAEWNGAMDPHAPEPLIFKEWLRALTRRLAADELGPVFEDFEGPRPLFVERVFRDIDGAGIWCDVDKTPEIETCRNMASLALDDALARLARDHGTAPEAWRWGAEHVAVHRHTPLGHLNPLGILFNIEQETGGGNHTLLRGLTPGRGSAPFRNVHAAGLRVVYDFADLDGSLMIIATGQSGHPFSQYYDHLSELWARGDMIPMSMSDDDARAGSLGTMTLVPAKGS